MAVCLKPRRGWDLGEKTEKGKPKLKFTSHYVDYVIGENGLPNHKYTEISCGKCINCKLKYATGWAIRCALETKEYKENYFITITYNEENLPINKHNDEYVGTLKKEDITKFLYRLRETYKRKYNHQGIKYYICGEYGEKTGRPHYHMMAFNLPINDLKKYSENYRGDILYTSPELEKIWGKGNLIIGQANYETANYVARYVLKQKLGKNTKKQWLEEGREPIYTVMSRKEAIGKKYLEKNWKEIINLDKITISTEIAKTLTTTPPKYFDKIMEKIENEKLEENKKRREWMAKKSYKEKLKNMNMNQDEYMNYVYENKMKKIKRLPRKGGD